MTQVQTAPLTRMKLLREILTNSKLVTALPTVTTFEAAELMTKERVGAVLVVDEAGHPQGMFTERDLMTRVVVPGEDPKKTAVGRKMTTELFCANPEMSVDATAKEMRQRHIRHLPIVEDGKIVGMLSLRDLLSANLTESKGEVKALTSYIQGGFELPVDSKPSDPE